MNNELKYSKLLGQVEVLSFDDKYTLVKVIKTNEVKKLVNKYANLQNTPFEKAKKEVAKKVEWTEEMENQYSEVFNDVRKMERISEMNRKNGKHGASKFL